MGVDDDIGGDSVGGEGHLGLADETSDDSLLSVPGTELVSEFGDPLVPDLDPGDGGVLLGHGEHDRVDPSALSVPDGEGCLPPLLGGKGLLLDEPGGRGLTDEDVSAGDLCLGGDQSVVSECGVCCVSTCSDDIGGGDLEVVPLPVVQIVGVLLLCTVGPEEGGTSESALDGALVHDDCILDVVSVVGEYRDTEVLSCGLVVVTDVLHLLGLHHRHLGVVEQVSAGIWSAP